MSEERGLFNFRDVMHYVGLPIGDNETSWAIGQMLAAHAARHGVEPRRLLTKKTNPEPTVAAEHCIAHYPIRLFPSACTLIRDAFADRARQIHLFEDV